MANSLSMSGIIVDIILFFIIAGNAAIGYKRGLTRVVFGLLSSIVAIILVLVLYRPVTSYIINNTNVSEKIESTFDNKLHYLFDKNNVENAQQLKENSDMSGILNVFIGNEMGNLMQETKDSMIRYLSTEITHKVISVLVFFILFAGVRLLLYVLRNYIEMIANLPIIRVLDGSGGMIYGVIRGFFVIYIILAFISLIMPMINDTVIIKSIQNAFIGSKMFNHNIILNIIFKFI